MAADPRQSNADPAEAAGGAEDGDADVVDFNALHAALGDLPPAPPSSSSPSISESQGKNSATYSSSRPHTIPPTRAPVADPNAPSIVIADDPPPQSAPAPHVNMTAQMTIPMGSPILSGVGAVSPGPMPVAPQRPTTPNHHFDPPRHPAADNVQQTIHMPGRPIAPPRRPRSPTMVVRVRGPSSTKKVLVFVMMLLLVVGIGLVILIVLRPGGIGLDSLPNGKPAPTFSPAPPKKP